MSAAIVKSAAVNHSNMGPVTWGSSSSSFSLLLLSSPGRCEKYPLSTRWFLKPDHHWYGLGLCIVVATLLYDPQRAVQVGPGNCLDPGDTVERRRLDNAAHTVDMPPFLRPADSISSGTEAEL